MSKKEKKNKNVYILIASLPFFKKEKMMFFFKLNLNVLM